MATASTASAASSQPAAACTEGKILLPPNDAATCWWVSSNLALFHKERLELEKFFMNQGNLAPLDEVVPEGVRAILLKAYKHYLNETTADPNEIVEDRKNPVMASYFNTPGQFDVAGGNFQDPSEYLSKFAMQIIPHIIITPDPKNKYTTTFWDMEAVQAFAGIQNANTGLVEKTQISRNAKTLAVWVKRSTQTAKDPNQTIQDPIPLPERISLPLSNYSESVQESTIDLSQESVRGDFKLDSILCGYFGHYWAIVNCTGTEEWYWFTGNTQSQLTEKYPSFDALVETYKTKDGGRQDVSKTAVVLFYTRVGDIDEAATDLPPQRERDGFAGSRSVKKLQEMVAAEIQELEGIYANTPATPTDNRLDLTKAKDTLSATGQTSDKSVNETLKEPTTLQLLRLEQIVNSYSRSERRNLRKVQMISALLAEAQAQLAKLQARSLTEKQTAVLKDQQLALQTLPKKLQDAGIDPATTQAETNSMFLNLLQGILEILRSLEIEIN